MFQQKDSLLNPFVLEADMKSSVSIRVYVVNAGSSFEQSLSHGVVLQKKLMNQNRNVVVVLELQALIPQTQVVYHSLLSSNTGKHKRRLILRVSIFKRFSMIAHDFNHI